MKYRWQIRKNKDILTTLFFKLLPVQILIVAMGAINSIVDGAVAGRCIDAGTVGVVGMYYSFLNLLAAVSSMLLGGTAVLCGRSMGRGDMRNTNGIFSLNITVTIICGVIFTLISAVAPGNIADILGASKELRSGLAIYVFGYAIGIIPMFLSQQFASFLQMERQNVRGYVGIAVMIVTNVTADILLVAIWDMGVFGLALATSFSNWAYFLTMLSYYVMGRSQLKYEIKSIAWKMTGEMIKIGFPGALLLFALALRGPVLNRILLKYTGNDGLAAQAGLGMVNGLFIAFAMGIGATLRILSSVAFGEEDRDSLKQLIKTAVIGTLPITVFVTASVLALSVPISVLFFPDTSSVAFRYSRELFTIYGCSIPLIVLCQIVANYLQAGEHNLYLNILSVFDGFFSMLIPARILAPLLGATGIWIANPIGMILTLLLSVGYACVFWRRVPRSLDEWLLLREDFGVKDEDRLVIMIREMKDVTDTASAVHEFCIGHEGIDRKTSFYAALCLEEMAGNVVRHGFLADDKGHMADVRIVIKDNGVLLRIKDDCRPFNPREMADLLTDEDPAKNIGLRMVMRLSNEMTYQNLMGLNVLTVRLTAAQ